MLITDNDEARIPYVKNFVQKLNLFDIPNLALLQGVNEPEVNMDTSKIKNILTSSKYLYTSGDQEDLTKWYGKVGTYQIPRDTESVRKEEALRECYDGGGPNNSNERGYKTVWFDDEVVRPDQLYAWIRKPDGSADTNKIINDYHTMGALASLAGGGCIFHYNGGKFNSLPTDFEALCYNAMMDGLEIFPLNTAKTGNWEHLRDLENADSPNPLALRIYKRGKYVVVVRPNGFVPPSNWKSLDNRQVCYEVS